MSEEVSIWEPPTGNNPYTTEELVSRFTNPHWINKKLSIVNDSINKIRYDNAKLLESITFVTYYDEETYTSKCEMFLGTDEIKIIRYEIDECGREIRKMMTVLALNGNIKSGDRFYISNNKECKITECFTFRKKDWVEILKLKE